MIAVPYSNVEKSILKFQSEIEKFRVEIEEKLDAISKDTKINKDQRRYVNKLIKISGNLITAKPATLYNYKKDFDKIISPTTMKRKSHSSFRVRILQALGYSQKRAHFYPKYFQQIGIDVCVYCNSMLTVSVEKLGGKKNKTIARFQVDHYIPKSDYPCFSISLYNLYPTCGSCNNVKSTSQVMFKLYDEESRIKNSNFYFELSMVSVSNYLLHRDNNLILYEFKEPKHNKKNLKSFNEVFAIQGIYDTQKSIAEELILKAEIYTETYKAELMKKFSTILNSASITDRLIMGNYTSEKDLHKRPMAKFMMDLSRQLGLI